MGYQYGRRYMRASQPRQENPELVTRIEKTVGRGISSLSDWERSFLGSLLESAKKWGRLTAKQHDVLQRIETKLDPKVQAARKSWNDSYTPEMREKAVFAAKYYKENPPYFGDAADRILTNEDYIPTEKLYRKMVENKYVQRTAANNTEAIKYPVGSMVTVRNTSALGGALRQYRGQKVIIIEAQEVVMSATKGARKYSVLPIGAQHAIQTEERYLKK
jgi:hypothetical protein